MLDPQVRLAKITRAIEKVRASASYREDRVADLLEILRELEADAREALPAQAPAPTLYSELLAAGVPLASHESDLYVKATPEARKILEKFPREKASARAFTNQVEGGIWLDVPFAFVPYWEKKQKVARELESGRG